MYDHINFTPPEGVRKEAKRGLKWRREHKRGGTAVGVARARDLSGGKSISPDTAKRMKSYFARHEVDKKGQGWSPGEEGFPSAGRIAWALWGGEAGKAWSKKLVDQMNAADKKDKSMIADLITYANSGDGFITTALPYVKTMSGFTAVGDWEKTLAEAGERLTFSDPGARVKSISEDRYPQGAILVYDAILSTSRKDRDGDIVRTDGMRLEEEMPLLWQHVWAQPIGKMLGIVEQNSNHVIAKYAIADTELGRDAAKLVRLGALRKSHGFFPVPGKFEPLESTKRADGSVKISGYDIKACDVYESSLVSIPANAGARVLRHYEKEADAVFKAVEEKMLECDAVKSWAKGLYDNRQRFFAGADFENRLEKFMSDVTESIKDLKSSVAVDAEKGAEKMAMGEGESGKKKCESCEEGYMDESGTCDHCGCTETKSMTLATKSIAEAGIEKGMGMPDALPGSFEKIQKELKKSAKSFLESKDISVSEYEHVDLLATFNDACVMCVRNWKKDSDSCFQVAWEMKDGKASFMGEPQSVEIEAAVVMKMFNVDDRINGISAERLLKAAFGKALASQEDSAEFAKEVKSVLSLLEKQNAPKDPLTELFG